jgi:hypothetical protein
MKRMPFERPTEYYDERIFPIDEQLCTLLKKRKEVSNNNPGFPPLEYISNWSKKYGVYEEFLNSLFNVLRHEEEFRPVVEPSGFRKHLPILKYVENDGRLYSVILIRQYENASVVQLNIDWDTTEHLPGAMHQSSFELFIGEEYDCRMDGGSGTTGHYSYNFIVSPPLPDDLSGIDLVFRQYGTPHKERPTGLKIKIQG